MGPNMPDDVIKYSSDSQEVLSRAELPEDKEPEILSLRPGRLSAYVGQEEVVETLKIAIEAATERGEPIDHVLFHGPPGLGDGFVGEQGGAHRRGGRPQPDHGGNTGRTGAVPGQPAALGPVDRGPGGRPFRTGLKKCPWPEIQLEGLSQEKFS